MAEPNDPITPARMRALGIIVFAQTMGIAVFAAVVVAMVQRQGPTLHGGSGIMSLIGAVMLAGMGTASILLPQAVGRQRLRRIARGEWRAPPGAEHVYASDAAKLFAVYLTTMMIGLALVESAGIFCCVAYLLEGQHYVLGLIALAVLLQIARFPTEGRVRAWIGRQLDLLEQERQNH